MHRAIIVQDIWTSSLAVRSEVSKAANEVATFADYRIP